MSIQTNVLINRIFFSSIGMATTVAAYCAISYFSDHALPLEGAFPLGVVLFGITILGGLRRIITCWVRHMAWKLRWRKIKSLSKKFHWPIRAPNEPDGQELLYHCIPYNRDLYMRIIYPTEGVLSFPCDGLSHEQAFGLISGGVLSAWRELNLPNVIVYRLPFRGGESLWIQAPFTTTRKVVAYAIVGLLFIRHGGMGQITHGGRVSFKFPVAQTAVNGRRHRGDNYVTMVHFMNSEEKFYRMMPFMALFYLPGFLFSRLEFVYPRRRQILDQMRMNGATGDSEEDILIDQAREEGAPLLQLDGPNVPVLVETLQVLKAKMLTALDTALRERR